MLKLVPHDALHPLYHEGDQYTALRHLFLLDYLLSTPVSPSDPRMNTREGLSVTNLAGRRLNFKKYDNGEDVGVVRLDGTKLPTRDIGPCE